MEIFYLTLNQMLTMFLFILLGYALRKSRILPDNSYQTMSRLETYIFVPMLVLHNWMTKCNPDSLRENGALVLYGLALVLVAVAISYPLSKLFVPKADSKEDKYQRNIYKYAMTFGNFGFVGNFLVLGVWGADMFFLYSMFTLLINFVCYSWGLFILIPGDGSAGSMKNFFKRMLTPPILALFAGMAAGLLSVQKYMPAFVMNVLSDGSKCMGPVAMILAGVVIGGYDIKTLLADKKVYVATFMRLVVIPACMLLVLKLFGIDELIVTLALIAFAVPLGLNTIVYPAAYGGDVKTGAAMAVISHTFSVITIPLMYLLFVVL